MPPPLDPAKRDAITRAIRDGAGERSAGSIAREHHVAVNTVTRLARAIGLPDAFVRDRTEKATAARNVDQRAQHLTRLSALAGRFVGLSEQILASYEAMTVDEWRAVSPHSRGIILGIAADKARDLTPADDDAMNERRELLGELFDLLQQAHPQPSGPE